jgi:hypothetical protein
MSEMHTINSVAREETHNLLDSANQLAYNPVDAEGKVKQDEGVCKGLIDKEGKSALQLREARALHMRAEAQRVSTRAYELCEETESHYKGFGESSGSRGRSWRATG